MDSLTRLAHVALQAGLLLIAGLGQAATVTVQSGPAQTHLLELFTSEGCSSCPPAENWFSTLRQSSRLWGDVVPIAFHINYWDNLGWTDALATPAFTKRQRDYAASWGASNIYTPELVLDGAEWRARDLNSIPEPGGKAGKLTGQLSEDGDVEITFQPASGAAGKWQAYAALLGFGVTSDVRAGENGGRHLIHDFVVLAMQEGAMQGAMPKAVLHLPADKVKVGQTALAVWVTKAGSLMPEQAAGGNL